MAKKLIPDYDFSLGATPQQQKGSIQSLYDKIAENEKSIYARINAPKIGGAGGLNYYDIERNFVKKRGDDIIYGNISVDAELKSTGFNENTNGWRLSKDTNGKGRLDIDDIYVRNSITTQILTYEKINATGGSLLLSSAWCTVESSEVLGTGTSKVIRIYYKPDGFNIQRWMQYDQAIIKSGLDKYLMSVVTAVSTTADAEGRFWIELYYGGGASGEVQPYYEQEGVYIPVAGDVVVQYGYRKSDVPSRQNIIKISVGDGLNSFPYIEQYKGIDSFDFKDKLITRISDDVYFGNGDQTKYIWWNKDDNSELLLKGTLVQSPTGATMPNIFWRGYYSDAATYYKSDLVQYLGVNYISISDEAHSQNTPPNETYWQIFADKGADGNSGAGYEIVYIGVSDTSDPNDTITNNPYVDNYLPSPLWSHTLIQPSPTNLYVWSTIRRKPAGQTYWNDFEPATIIYKYTKDGNPGNNAKLITLVASTQIINESELGVRTPSEINVSSIVQNTIISDWYFSVNGDAFSVFPPAGVELRGSSVVNIQTDQINFITLSIKATDGIFSDTVTISRTTDASSNILVDLSNQSHTIVCDSDGVPLAGELAAAKTLVNVYRGSTLLTLNTDWIFNSDEASNGISYEIIGNEVSVTGIIPSVNSGYIDLDIEVLSSDLIIRKRFSISKSKNGGNGNPGSEGKGYQTIYTSTADKDTSPTYINPSVNYLSEGWSDTPTGVGPLLRAQWRSTRVSVGGVFGDFSTAALDATYSADGATGKDGLYVKYIYKRTITPEAPDAPSNYQDWEADGWTDDPMGVTPVYPYEFVSYAQFDPNTGLYSAWSPPVEWSRYAFSGMAIRYTRWKEGVVYYDGTYHASNPLRYKDYVVDVDYAGVVRAYECTEEHLSFYSGRPTLNSELSRELWSNISYQPAIATDVLLANQAVIGGFMFSAAMVGSEGVDPINQYLRTTDDETDPAILMRGDGYASFAKRNVVFDKDGNATIKGFINAVGGRIGDMKIDGSLNAAGIEISPTPMESIAQLSSPTSENLTSAYYDDEAIDENVHVQVQNISSTFTGYATIKVDFHVDNIQFDNTTYDVIVTRGQEIVLSYHGNFDVLQTQTVSDSIRVIPGEQWNIDAFITVGEKFGAGSQTNYVKVYGDGSLGEIVNSNVVQKTKLSSDGFFSFWSPIDYVYFKNAGAFEVRKGFYGMQISQYGVKKWNPTTLSWVDIDYANW